MPRYLTIEFNDDITEEQYAQVANTIWAVASLTPSMGAVYPDSSADPKALDSEWSDQPSWNEGDMRVATAPVRDLWADALRERETSGGSV